MSQSVARIVNPTLQNILPSRTTLYQQATNVRSLGHLYNGLLRVLEAIDGVHVNPERTDSPEVPSVLVTATEITWSRSARRKKTSSPMSQKACQGSIILQCRITCAEGSYPVGKKQQVTGRHLVYQWVDGSDRGVLESFVGHVNRKVTAVEPGS